ncbi:integrase family protein, partial [sediment metagenome]
KSELIEATWDEVDFENAVWTIPKSRMKAGKPHNVYLSQQALDIMVALRTCASGSKFLLPSRYDADRCMSKATLNRVTQTVAERAKEAKLPLEPFTVHDLRRTGSTILNELGFNSDWIEKCLAHEDGRSSRGVYNKAEYAEQRRHMLQEWADMIDAWVRGSRIRHADAADHEDGDDGSADMSGCDSAHARGGATARPVRTVVGCRQKQSGQHRQP